MKINFLKFFLLLPQHTLRMWIPLAAKPFAEASEPSCLASGQSIVLPKAVAQRVRVIAEAVGEARRARRHVQVVVFRQRGKLGLHAGITSGVAMPPLTAIITHRWQDMRLFQLVPVLVELCARQNRAQQDCKLYEDD